MLGIVSFGAYVPRLRLQRAAMVAATAWFNQNLRAHERGERALASWDEDAITMGVEAARDCLEGRERARVGRLVLASTTLPFADRQNAVVVKEALNLADTVGTMDVAGSQRAATTALIAMLERDDEATEVLCVAAERRRARAGSEAEFINGDAAAALLLGPHDPVAEVVGMYSSSVDFVDHFRTSEQTYDYEWEGRWVREEGYRGLLPAALNAALAKFGLAAADIDHLVAPLPLAGADHAVATAIGCRPEALCPSLGAVLGFAGAAHPLVMLAKILETAKPGALIVLVAFGQGCDVIAFRTTQAIARPRRALGVSGWLARRAPEDNYIKHLAFAGEVTLDGGMRGELNVKTPMTLLYRDRKTLLGLVGGRCRETGVVQYPKSVISVGGNARTVGTQDDYPLADRRARALTTTADHLAFTPSPPSRYGMVEFEGGGRMVIDFADVGEAGVQVGDHMRMMFRLKRTDSAGFKHYFWKAVPDYRPAD